MESINFEKIQALKKYKQQQFINSLMFYPIVGLTCGVFCTSPFWFPTLSSTTKNFFFVSIPNIMCFFFNVKSLFILGNLIIVFLLKESKVYALCSLSPPRPKIDVVRDIEEVGKRQISLPTVAVAVEVKAEEEVVVEEDVSISFRVSRKPDFTTEEKESEEVEVMEEEGEEVEDLEENNNGFVNDDYLLIDELNRRAESFIAMVNKQIRLEAAQLEVLV